MRDYARVAPTFWTRGSGKKLRGDADAQLVALYLLTCPASNMIGLYYLSLPTLGHETGLPMDRVRAAMATVAAAEIAFYDEDAELVFLPEGAKYQIGQQLRGDDRRIKGVEKDLEAFGRHRFVEMFVARYINDFSLTITDVCVSNSKPLASPLQAPCKPGSGSGASQDYGTASAAPTPSSSEAIQKFSTGHGDEVGPLVNQDGPRTNRSVVDGHADVAAAPSPRKAPRGANKKPESDCPSSDAGGDEVKAWLSKWNVTGDEAEVSHWLDHHRSKGNRFRDWAASWRTWQRNGVRFGRSPAMPSRAPEQKKPIEMAQVGMLMDNLRNLEAGECVR